jgi:hypothetical protein
MERGPAGPHRKGDRSARTLGVSLVELREIVPDDTHVMRSQALVARLLFGAVLELGTGLILGCTSIELVATDSGPEAAPACILDVATQNGTACEAPPGYLCPTGFPCTDLPLAQQANCICMSGKWQCFYAAGDGGAIPPGSTPECASAGQGMQSDCPANETPGAACTVAVAGLLCTYPGETCELGSAYPDSDSSVPNIDTCQCVGAPDAGPDASLVFSCERTPCNAVIDGGVPSQVDAGQAETGTQGDSGATLDAPTNG